MLSHAVCEVASGVVKASGVVDADTVPGRGVSVISGVLVGLEVGGIWGVLVAVGMDSTVCVCRASAVDAICVKIEMESTVGVVAAPPPLQADRPSRAKAIKSEDIFIRRFMITKSPFQ